MLKTWVGFGLWGAGGREGGEGARGDPWFPRLKIQLRYSGVMTFDCSRGPREIGSQGDRAATGYELGKWTG